MPHSKTAETKGREGREDNAALSFAVLLFMCSVSLANENQEDSSFFRDCAGAGAVLDDEEYPTMEAMLKWECMVEPAMVQ